MKNLRDYKNGLQFDYVLDCINNDEYTLTDDIEKITYFFDRFNEEYNNNYNKHIMPNLQKRIGSYLQGLPSSCSVIYWNDEIIKLGKSWGYCQTEKKAQNFLENYWNVLGFRLIQIANYYKLDISKYY